MYNKQEKKVLDLIRQVDKAFNELVFPPDSEWSGSIRKTKSLSQRRSESVVHDNDVIAFRELIAQLERNLKARAADRLNELDLSDYVKQAIKDNHPNAVDIDFKVTFTNQEVTKQKMEVTPSEYGSGISTRMAKKQLDTDEEDCVTRSLMEDDDDEDGY